MELPSSHRNREQSAGREAQSDSPNKSNAALSDFHLDAAASSLMYHALDQYLQMQEAGEAVDIENYCKGFPLIAENLATTLRNFHYVNEGFTSPRKINKANWPQPGDRFAGFHLLELLGEGALGRVFRASELELGERQVVVKVSPFGAVEANIQGGLEHPNIVPINSVREELRTGLTVICMPYLGRTTLQTLVTARRRSAMTPEAATTNGASQVGGDPSPSVFPISEALDDRHVRRNDALPELLVKGGYFDAICFFARDLAQALSYIHDKGIQHRDVKPSNVLITPSGKTLLTDFNLSVDPRYRNHLRGGTPRYISPEQLIAIPEIQARRLTSAADFVGSYESPRIDARTDLYSFAVVFYELLAGRHPFLPDSNQLTDVELAEFLLSQQQRQAVSLRQLCPEADPAIAALIDQSLAFQPENRPASADVVVSALDDYLRRRIMQLQGAENPADTRPLTTASAVVQQPAERSRKTYLTRRFAIPFLALLLFLAAGTLVISMWRAAAPAPARENPRILGEEAFKKGEYVRAAKHFDRLLQENPNNVEALFARARCYLFHSKKENPFLSSALSDFFLADKLNDHPMIDAARGYCLHWSGEDDAAIFEYKEAVRGGLESAEIYNNLGYIYKNQNKLREALDCFSKALELKPHLATVHHNRALLYLNQFLALRPRKNVVSAKDAPRKSPIILAIEDINEALKCGEPSGQIYQDAAVIHATALEIDAADSDQVVELLEKAIDYGIPARKLQNSTGFAALRDSVAFKNLNRIVPTHREKKNATRKLDPCLGRLYFK